MFNALSQHISYAKHLRGSFLEKLLLFISFNRLLIKHKLFKTSNNVVQNSILGFRIFSFSHSSTLYLTKEIFVDEAYRFESKKDQPVIIDCGANIGLATLYFKRLFPDSRIYAFEANPHAFELLERNISSNSLQSITAYNVALFDRQTELSFYTGGQLGSLTGSIHPQRGGSARQKVKAEKLSNYIKELGEIDLVKIDVEGAEHNIMRDLADSGTISSVRQYIVEYHHNLPEQPSTFSDFLKLFEANGFRYHIKGDFGAQGFIQDILLYIYRQ